MFGAYEHTIDRSGALHLPGRLRRGEAWVELSCWWSPSNRRVLCFAPGGLAQAAREADGPSLSLPVREGKVCLPASVLSRLGERAVVICETPYGFAVWPRSLWES